jgi:hypothetical protein
MELRISKGFLEWFECKILDLGTNLLQWFDVLYPQKDKVHSTTKLASLWEKISQSSQNFEKLVEKKVKLAPWMEEGTRNLLAQIGSYGVLWILNTTNVFPLLGGDN